MAVYLTILLLDKKSAVISTSVYLLIGFVGLPVFSGFTGGVGKLFGPTGGYLVGYLVLSWSAGSILETIQNLKKDRMILQKKAEGENRKGRMLKQILALFSGTLGLYFFGTFWLMYQSNLTFLAALSVGVLPFVIFDAIKILAAVVLGNSIKKRISFMV